MFTKNKRSLNILSSQIQSKYKFNCIVKLPSVTGKVFSSPTKDEPPDNLEIVPESEIGKGCLTSLFSASKKASNLYPVFGPLVGEKFQLDSIKFFVTFFKISQAPPLEHIFPSLHAATSSE